MIVLKASLFKILDPRTPFGGTRNEGIPDNFSIS